MHRARKAAVAVGAVAVAVVSPAAAQATTKSVYMGTPPKYQKDLQKYSADANAFFPKGIKIHTGDSVRFVPVGFHDVNFPKNKGKAPLAIITASGQAAAGVNDAAGNPFWFNGLPVLSLNPVLARTNNYGKKATYTASKGFLSGLPLADKPKAFTIKFPKSGSYTYLCDVHPGMKGTVTVVGKKSKVPTAKADTAAISKQIAAAKKTAAALAASSVPANTIDVGHGGAGGVEIFDFLPDTLTVPVGTTVTFRMLPGTFEVHTATTGPGDPENDPNSFLGKLAASFEAPTTDPAATYPSDQPPAPAVITPTIHGNGFWSSGILDGSSVTSAIPSSNAATFGAPGTYTFYCLIHPFMKGTVVVQ